MTNFELLISCKNLAEKRAAEATDDVTRILYQDQARVYEDQARRLTVDEAEKEAAPLRRSA